jgi:ATP-dependent Clp protease ATP-binding subunit ClpA
LPIEVLTREEIEKIVEEKLKKLLSEMRIAEKIAELKVSTSKLAEDVSRLATREAPVPSARPLVTALAKDLGPLADMLEIQDTKDSVTLRPKARLREQDFRTVRETVSQHGGLWSYQTRMFIVPKNPSK